MFWTKNEATEFLLTMDGHGSFRYESRLATYWSGPFLSKGLLRMRYEDTSSSVLPYYWVSSSAFGKFSVFPASRESQPGKVVPHQVSMWWKGHITPDQSKTIKGELIEALRKYLQQESEEAQATYAAVLVSWRTHQVSESSEAKEPG